MVIAIILGGAACPKQNSKAKDESTTSYFVQTIDIPSLTKEVYDDDIPF